MEGQKASAEEDAARKAKEEDERFARWHAEKRAETEAANSRAQVLFRAVSHPVRLIAHSTCTLSNVLNLGSPHTAAALDANLCMRIQHTST